MARLRFLVNNLVRGTYTCHARVESDSAQEHLDFLEREQPSDTNGWQISISTLDRKGYDGKPVYQTDIRLSTPYPRVASQKDAEQTDHPEEICHEDQLGYGLDHAPTDGLSWTEQATFQRETTALLDQMGVTDLGWRHGR